ncbi:MULTISPECIES: hypothetical protein [unclassified Streptomyces]|nr:hypothetical protein [Streptomyces sp. I6]
MPPPDRPPAFAADAEARAAFESGWNRYHRIRAVLVLAALVLLVAAALS